MEEGTANGRRLRKNVMACIDRLTRAQVREPALKDDVDHRKGWPSGAGLDSSACPAPSWLIFDDEMDASVGLHALARVLQAERTVLPIAHGLDVG
jgi:hypothetical protein